jgi:integrase
MGHHSIKITVDIYGHLVPGANKQAVDRLDDATGRNLYATATA